MPVRPVAETLTRATLAKWCGEYATILRSPGQGLWLVPDIWARETILAELLNISAAVLSPNILTFEEFAACLAGDQVRPATATHWGLHDTISELIQRKSLPHHGAIAERKGFFVSSIGYFEELAENGLSPGIAEAALRSARGAKREDIARLTRAVADRGAKATRGWSFECMARATERIADALPKPFHRVKTVLVSGFRFFTPAERRLLDALAARVDDTRVALFADPARTRPETFTESKSTWQSFLSEVPAAPTGKPKPAKEPAYPRPAGIAHLAGQLFRESPAVAGDASGVSLIKAPGEVGELRLIARRIRQSINAGTNPESIVIASADVAGIADVLTDVFAEYSIPLFHESDAPLHGNPTVRTLLRAARIDQDDWLFDDVTALLRSNYFQPVWPEAKDNMARHAEGLLRQLGEPKGREACLRAAQTWANSPPEALEDEQAEVHRRRRKGELARKCLPFLKRFFAAWDGRPAATTAQDYALWLRKFADDIGLSSMAAERKNDRRALEILWQTLAEWSTPPIMPIAFWRGVGLLAEVTPQPRNPRWAGRVRALSPEAAAETACECLFIIGMGEQHFPNFDGRASLLDEGDRQALRDHGLRLPSADLARPREELLFLQLVARPSRELILSYPAVDERGQELLPGVFLRAVTELFADGVLPVTHQRMLIEGHLTREALSDAEHRVQWADRLRDLPDDTMAPIAGLKPAMAGRILDARQLARARFHDKHHNEFSGLFQSDSAKEFVRSRFGPNRVLSPTALETYVACPFRFWLEHLLGLEELEEPGEEIEHTRRGAAYHRALSRLHLQLQRSDPMMALREVPERVTGELTEALQTAIGEYVERAPSAVSKMLWRLEGERLQRSAQKYRNDWNDYLSDWHEEHVALRPELFEVDFGFGPADAPGARGPLVIRDGDSEVRIGGRIDRVDVADITGDNVGFWIIDYKTGRKTSYVASQLESLEKLQLPLYALAVQKVFYDGKPARPLGLAYWLVTDDGAKKMMPRKGKFTAWLRDPAAWEEYRKLLEAWVMKLAGHIRNAEFPLAPRSENCTATCAYSHVCRIAQSRGVEKDWRLELPVVREPEETGLIAEV